MKLKIIDEDNEVVYLDVGFWSFMKCSVLTSLALTGMMYGALIILVLVFGMW